MAESAPPPLIRFDQDNPLETKSHLHIPADSNDDATSVPLPGPLIMPKPLIPSDGTETLNNSGLTPADNSHSDHENQEGSHHAGEKRRHKKSKKHHKKSSKKRRRDYSSSDSEGNSMDKMPAGPMNPEDFQAWNYMMYQSHVNGSMPIPMQPGGQSINDPFSQELDKYYSTRCTSDPPAVGTGLNPAPPVKTPAAPPTTAYKRSPPSYSDLDKIAASSPPRLPPLAPPLNRKARRALEKEEPRRTSPPRVHRRSPPSAPHHSPYHTSPPHYHNGPSPSQHPPPPQSRYPPRSPPTNPSSRFDRPPQGGLLPTPPIPADQSSFYRDGPPPRRDGPPPRRDGPPRPSGPDLHKPLYKPPPKPKKNLPCRFFQQNGFCKKLEDCDFLHADPPRNGTAITSSASYPGPIAPYVGFFNGTDRKAALCRYYLQGNCRKNNCDFLHEEFPCKFFHSSANCVNGDKCRFSHASLTPETKAMLDKTLDDQILSEGWRNVVPPGAGPHMGGLLGPRPPPPPPSAHHPPPVVEYVTGPAKPRVSVPVSSNLLPPVSQTSIHAPAAVTPAVSSAATSATNIVLDVARALLMQKDAGDLAENDAADQLLQILSTATSAMTAQAPVAVPPPSAVSPPSRPKPEVTHIIAEHPNMMNNHHHSYDSNPSASFFKVPLTRLSSRKSLFPPPTFEFSPRLDADGNPLKVDVSLAHLSELNPKMKLDPRLDPSRRDKKQSPSKMNEAQPKVDTPVKVERASPVKKTSPTATVDPRKARAARNGTASGTTTANNNNVRPLSLKEKIKSTYAQQKSATQS